MRSKKNLQNNPTEESISQQLDLIGDSKNILNLGGPLISNLLNKNNIQFSEIKSNLSTSRYVDKLSIEKSWTDELPNSKNKFDLIILHDLFDQTKEPKLLLENLSNYLSDTGSIIGTVKNVFYLENICKIFEGIMPETNSNIYDLDSLNLFLNNENFILSELKRNQKSDVDSNSDIKEYIFPSKILEFLRKDPESEVISYVFRIKKKNLVDLQARKWLSTFPKNYFLEYLKNKFDYYETLEQAIKDKDDVISGLEQSLMETKLHMEQSFDSKDDVISGLEQSLKETKLHMEQSLSDKDDVISRLESSLKNKDEIIEEFTKTIFGKAFNFFRKNR